MAPSRPLINSKFRSMSEPNLPECLLREQQQSDRSPDYDLPFLNEDEDSSQNNVVPLQSYSQLPPQLMPVDKDKNIKNFLASLPSLQTIDDDQGIGENAYTSESGSGSSSPILTPTDDEQFNLRHKLVKEIREEKSSKVKRRKRYTNTEDLETGSSPTDLSGGYYSQSSSSQLLDKAPHSHINIPPKPSPPVTVGSTKSKVSPPPGSSSITTPMMAQLRQPIAFANQLQYKILPRAKATKATSVPHSLALAHNASSFMTPKLTTISPESSKTSLSSMVLPEREEVVEEGDYQAEDSIMITVTDGKGELTPDHTDGEKEGCARAKEREGHTRQSSDGALQTLAASSSCEGENTTSETGNQHRRAKSDGENVSVPTQIPSVPHRVKEIEEMNSVLSSALSGVSSNNNGGSSTGAIYMSTSPNTEEKQLSDSSASVSDEKQQSIGSLSRTSSEHSLSSCSRDIELEVLAQSSVTSGSPHCIRSTRHGSLSPNPPSLQMKMVTEQTRCTSLMYLPQSEQEHQQQPQQGELTEENLASSLMGAVKARVQDIEEKNKENSGVARSKCSPEKSEVPRKVTPPPTKPVESATSNVVDDSTTEDKEVEKSLVNIRRHSITAQPRPSSEVFTESESSLPVVYIPRMERRESTPPALFSAWSQWVSAEGIPSKPVQDLKQKFEDSTKEQKSFSKSVEANPRTRAVDMLRVGSNLRRSQSLKAVGSPSGNNNPYRHRRKKSPAESPSAFAPISDVCSQD